MYIYGNRKYPRFLHPNYKLFTVIITVNNHGLVPNRNFLHEYHLEYSRFGAESQNIHLNIQKDIVALKGQRRKYYGNIAVNSHGFCT